MSEAATQQAVEPAAAPSPVAPAEPAEMTLDDALMSIEPPADESAAVAAPPEEPGESAPEGDTEEPAEAEDGDEPAPAAAAEKEDFSDDRPWTPERIKKAAKAAKDEQRKAFDLMSQARRMADRAGRKYTEAKREKELAGALQARISADLKLVEDGDFEALGRLGNRDGYKIYERMSLRAAGAKADPGATELAEVKAKLAAIEQERQAEKQAAQQSVGTFSARQRVAAGVQNLERFPALAAAAKEWGFAETCAAIEQGIVARYGSFGQHVDIESVLAHAELTVRNEQGLVGPGAGDQNPPAASGADAGREPSAAAVAKPEQARRTPGRSVTPSISSTSGARRVLEDGESTEELANDPGFLVDLGLIGG